MIEVLRFIFSGPFIFIGVVILLCICFDGVANIIKAIRGKQKTQAAPTDGPQEEAQ